MKEDPPILQGTIVAVSIVVLAVTFLMDSSILVGWVTFIPNRLSRMTVNWSGVSMMALCLVLTAGFAHSFCSWLWRGSGRTEPWRPKWTAAGLVVVVLMFVSGIAVTGVAQQVRRLMDGDNRGHLLRNARRALHAIEMIQVAQNQFQLGDRDENKIQDYWRADIAGLHAFKVNGKPIDLIDLDIAAADDRAKSDLGPTTKFAPYWGYVFHALLHEEEKAPNPNWYAACAVPVSPAEGSLMFLIAPGVMLKKPYSGETPARFPKDPAVDGWTEVDR